MIRDPFRIESTGPGQYRALIGDHDISNSVRGVRLDMKGGHLPGIELDLVLWEVTVELDKEPVYRIPPETEKALIALGWTPPAGIEAP
jgi:hypothetical protein